jgi:SAM-dependent methyltransferase
MKKCISCGIKFESNNWQCPSCCSAWESIDGHMSFLKDPSEINESFDPGYFEELFKVEADSFWFQSRNNLIILAMQRYFPKSKNFFEIGCGTGFVLSGLRDEFPEMAMSGSDFYISALDYAEKRLGRLDLFQMDARNMPFDSEFDLIGAFDVIEHIKEDEAVLGQMFQATKPGGGIVLTVPQHGFLWSYVDKYSGHVRRYSARELKSKVGQCGFEVIDTISFVSLLLPLIMLSRFKKQNPDIMAGLKLGRTLNSILQKIMNIECSLIRLGIRLPFGGSLLLVAKRPGEVNIENDSI